MDSETLANYHLPIFTPFPTVAIMIMEYPPRHACLFYITIFCHFYLLFLLRFTAADDYIPTDNLALDCGSSGNSTASDGRVWTGDIGLNSVTLQSRGTTVTVTATDQGAVEVVPYPTARISSSEFTYVFPVTAGPKFVRLYFFPTSYATFERSKALFSVRSGHYTLLNSNWGAEALGAEPFAREFCVNVEEGSEILAVTFSPSPSSSNDSYAFVNGIEIVSMPPNLYYTPAGGNGPPYIGQSILYEIERSTALETMYRLEVGGDSISATGDSGMFRVWVSDKKAFFRGGGVFLTMLDTTIKYTKETAAYVAPEQVYQTSRSMGADREWNLSNNLTWILPVEAGFMYLVRLHFCDTNPSITEVGDRVFMVYVDGQIAEKAADAIRWSGGNSVPVYRDYAVRIGSGGRRGEYNLSIDVHAREDFTLYSDALLNGIELFKLNDTAGSLASSQPMSH